MEKKTKLKIKFYRKVFTIFYLKSLNTVAISSCLSDWYLTLISHLSCNVHATWVWYYWSTVQSIHVPALSLLKIANCIEIIIKSQHQLRYCLLNNASLRSVLIYKPHRFKFSYDECYNIAQPYIYFWLTGKLQTLVLYRNIFELL